MKYSRAITWIVYFRIVNEWFDTLFIAVIVLTNNVTLEV